VKNRVLKKILIIQTASLGDVILTTPVIEKLHAVFPDIQIDFLLKYGYQDIFKNHPFVHRVIVWDKSERKYHHLKELIKVIRERKYDIIINIQRFAASGLITILSGAKIKIGFNKNPFSLFFTKSVKHTLNDRSIALHETDRNLKLVEDLTGNHSKFPVRLYPSTHDDAKMSPYKTKAYITISPGSLWFTKTYPEKKWVEMISSLDKELNVYLLGSKDDAGLCDNIKLKSEHPNCLNLAGKLTFLESASLMRDAMMNYSNDSAPMHLASSVNAPITAIYCSTIPGFGFGPLSDKSFIIQTNKILKCKPCGIHGLNTCPEGHFECAMSIENKQLLENI
jgi:heptosyltransferase-2